MKNICNKRYEKYKNCGGIYYILNNLNRKYYIGSAKNFRTRFNEHERDLKKKKHANTFLLNEYCCGKYKHDQFVFGILEIVGSENDLIAREQKYLDVLYDNQNKCYNICPTAGSALGRKHSTASKLKISIGNKGKKRTEEYKKRMSLIKKSRKQKIWFKSGKNNPMHGRIGKNHPNAVTVQQINPITNEIVETYYSLKEAQEKTNIRWVNIHKVTRGKRKTAGGYRWVIIKESGLSKSLGREVLNIPLKKPNPNITPVCQIEPSTGKIIATFKSIINASKNTSINRTNISSALNKKTRTAGGFVWIKKSDLPRNVDLNAKENEGLKLKSHKSSKPIQQIDLKTNKLITTYCSVPKASKATGISRSTIANALCGRAKTAGGYKWKKKAD